jgi:hypothetical protein
MHDRSRLSSSITEKGSCHTKTTLSCIARPCSERVHGSSQVDDGSLGRFAHSSRLLGCPPACVRVSVSHAHVGICTHMCHRVNDPPDKRRLCTGTLRRSASVCCDKYCGSAHTKFHPQPSSYHLRGIKMISAVHAAKPYACMARIRPEARS